MKRLERIVKPGWWKSYFLLAVLTNELLSYVLQASVFVIREDSLSAVMVLVTDGVSMIVTAVFLALAVLSYRKGIVEEQVNKSQVLEWLVDGIFVFISVVGVKFIPALVVQYLTLLSPYVALGVGAIFFLAFSINLVIQVWIAVIDLQTEQSFLPKSYILKRVLKKPVMVVWVLVFCLGGYFGKVAVDTLFYGIASAKGNSIALQMLDKVAICIVYTMLCIWFLSKADGLREYIYRIEAESRGVEIYKCKRVFLYILLGISVAYFGANAVYVMGNNPRVNAAEYMDALMEEAGRAVELNNTSEAVRIYALVETYLSAMEAYASEDLQTLNYYVQNNPGDDFLWRLYYTYVDDVAMAESMLIDAQTDTRLCHDILAYYATSEVARNEAEEELVEDCIWICLLEGDFIKSSVKLDEASLRKKPVNDIKEKYEDTLAYNDLMTLLLKGRANGVIDENTAYGLLDMAEAHPEDSAYQLMAVLGGSQYLYDGAKHYDRVVACAERLDEQMSAKNTDTEKLIEQKLYLAKMVMECDDYDAALKFLMDVRLEKNTEVEDSILICYSEAKRDGDVLAYVEELRAAGQDRAYIDYFAGLACLRMGNVSEALENGAHLAEKVQSDEAMREENNALLFSLAEYMCISDRFDNYIDYYYRITDYTPEQLEFLKTVPLLENYLIALHSIHNSRNYDAALESIEKVEEICPGLSMTWFLKGTTYFDLRDYDNAIECFKKCISIDENNTTAIYSLAVLYDVKGEYDLSMQLCEQIMNVMPTVNHEKDWYGVSYHTRALYAKIQEYVGGQR